MSWLESTNGQIQPTDFDRRICQRIVPMKVLCLGLSRTGTESLGSALMRLGYNETYHGYTGLYANPRDCEMWAAAMRAKFDGVGKPFGRKEFDQLLGNCQAVLDIPAVCFAEELIAAYPEAKVVLTVRDFEGWEESMKLYTHLGNISWWFGSLRTFMNYLGFVLFMPWRWSSPTYRRAIKEMYAPAMNGGDPARKVFEGHIEKIKSLVAADRLLVYDVRQGWEPLCEFLGQPVPNEPMPSGNSKADLVKRVKATFWKDVRECWWRVGGMLAYASLGVVGWKWARGEWTLGLSLGDVAKSLKSIRH
ncbi:P-loop containing nucleoside triphosphate hydrolase protein [Aspergillus unguis]